MPPPESELPSPPPLPPPNSAASMMSPFQVPSAVKTETENTNVFPGYKELVQLRQRSLDLHKRIDTLTLELADVRKGAASAAQKVQLHQLNNALHRANYEFDVVLEDYRKKLVELLDGISAEWLKIKDNWIQTEEQTFLLQVLQAKCTFLKQGAEALKENLGETFKQVTDLDEELTGFANSHLAAGSVPDDTLLYFGNLVQTLSKIFVSVQELIAEVPEWGAALLNPTAGSLSIPFLKEINEKVQERITQIPFDIGTTKRLLPGGTWKRDADLLPEIYGFANLLHPTAPIHKLPIHEILLYLDDDANCRLRKQQIADLKQYEVRCKQWLDTRTQHSRLIEKAKVMAKEGNYLQAEKSIATLTPIFSDLNYTAYEQDAKKWKDDLQALQKRLGDPLEQTHALLKQIERNLWSSFGKLGGAKALLEKNGQAIESEASALKAFSTTDYYRDAQLPLEQLRQRQKENVHLHTQAVRLVRLGAMAGAIGLIALVGFTGALIASSIRAREASVTITVRPLDSEDPVPTIHFGTMTTNSFKATFPRLQAGAYPLTVTCPGFENFTNRVTLKTAERLKLSPFTLEPINGFLRLGASSASYHYEVHPVDRDRIVTSGALAANDAADLTLRPGRYDVFLTQGNRKFDVKLDVKPREITLYNPDFRFSHVKVTSQPVGAIVSIDGNDIGFTPLETMLSPLPHTLALRMTGFLSSYQPIQPKDGQPITLNVALVASHPVVNPPPPNPSIPQPIPRPAKELEKVN